MSGSARSLENNNIARVMIKQHAVTQLGVPVLAHPEWLRAGRPDDCLIDGFPYTGIYGKTDAKSDLVLIHPTGRRARIIVKWQGTSGSTDEKFPYVMENAFVVPENDVVILAGGTGAKPAAVRWLVDEAAARSVRTLGRRDVQVMRSVDEVSAWLRSIRDEWLDARAALPPTEDGRLL